MDGEKIVYVNTAAAVGSVQLHPCAAEALRTSGTAIDQMRDDHDIRIEDWDHYELADLVACSDLIIFVAVVEQFHNDLPVIAFVDQTSAGNVVIGHETGFGNHQPGCLQRQLHMDTCADHKAVVGAYKGFHGAFDVQSCIGSIGACRRKCARIKGNKQIYHVLFDLLSDGLSDVWLMRVELTLKNRPKAVEKAVLSQQYTL